MEEKIHDLLDERLGKWLSRDIITAAATSLAKDTSEDNIQEVTTFLFDANLNPLVNQMAGRLELIVRNEIRYAMSDIRKIIAAG